MEQYRITLIRQLLGNTLITLIVFFLASCSYTDDADKYISFEDELYYLMASDGGYSVYKSDKHDYPVFLKRELLTTRDGVHYYFSDDIYYKYLVIDLDGKIIELMDADADILDGYKELKISTTRENVCFTNVDEKCYGGFKLYKSYMGYELYLITDNPPTCFGTVTLYSSEDKIIESACDYDKYYKIVFEDEEYSPLQAYWTFPSEVLVELNLVIYEKVNIEVS